MNKQNINIEEVLGLLELTADDLVLDFLICISDKNGTPIFMSDKHKDIVNEMEALKTENKELKLKLEKDCISKDACIKSCTDEVVFLKNEKEALKKRVQELETALANKAEVTLKPPVYMGKVEIPESKQKVIKQEDLHAIDDWDDIDDSMSQNKVEHYGGKLRPEEVGDLRELLAVKEELLLFAEYKNGIMARVRGE